MVAYTVEAMPRWNPINICSYHLQEAGATPVQEIAYAMCTAIAVLDAVRDSGQVPPERFGEVVARISFFVNAGVRFVEEMCKMRAFVALWDELTRERYGVHRPRPAPLPVRRAGQLPRADRGPAGEQRPADRAGDAGGDPVQGRAGAGGAAAGLERGARPAPAVGPAVVAADAAGPRATSPTCSSTTTCSPARPSSRPRSPSCSRAHGPRSRPCSGMGGAVAAVECGYMKSALVAAHSLRRRGSSPASRSWSASTGSAAPSRAR